MDHRTPLLIDSHGRILRDLRVSVTDRCNFRCLYCLPETEAAANFYRERWATVVNSTPIARQWKPKSKILTFEELERFVRLAVGLDIHGAQNSMQVDPYITLAKALERAGLTAQRTRPDQLIVSAQEGPVWPNRGNSFWLSHIEGTW